MAGGALLLAAGLLWLLLVMPWQPCDACGAAPVVATALTPGVVATASTPAIGYSPGWRVTDAGADPAQPAAPWVTPAGVITLTYTGDALWLLLAPGDYWAYLYATVDDQPANRLATIGGNLDSRGEAAGYTTLLAPELAAQTSSARLRWVEVHRAQSLVQSLLQSLPQSLLQFLPQSPGVTPREQTVRLEFWRGWGQLPLRGVAVDPPAAALQPAGARLPWVAAPRWPGVLLLISGIGLAGGAIWRRAVPRRVPSAAAPQGRAAGSRMMVRRSAASLVWLCFALGATLVIAGTFTAIWPLTTAGVVLLGGAAIVRPALWFAALLFALPFAYAVTLPLLPGRSLGLIDVGIAGGVAILIGHTILWRFAIGEPAAAARHLDRAARLAFVCLVLVVGWALVVSFDVRYPALALREWRTVFLNPVIFAALLIYLLRRVAAAPADLWLLVSGWLEGAAVMALIGLWGFATGVGFVSAAEGVRRVQALYDSANNLALYLDRTLAVTLALLLFVRRRRERIVWALLAAPQGAAWLLTFSKGALLLAAPAMLLVLGVGGFWLLRRQLRGLAPLVVLAAVCGGGALALAPFIGAERFQRLFDLEQGTGFLRLQLWRSAWQMALDHPWLGVGPDQFLYFYRSGYLLPSAWQEPNLNHPHNLLLDWWTRLGVVGLVLGMSWLLAGVWGVGRWLRGVATQPREAALALGCLAAVAAGLAHGLIDVSYALPELMIVWVLIFHVGTGWRAGIVAPGADAPRP